jgi:hypothetical protein
MKGHFEKVRAVRNSSKVKRNSFDSFSGLSIVNNAENGYLYSDGDIKLNKHLTELVKANSAHLDRISEFQLEIKHKDDYICQL